jgi:ADP-ribose pyrophosphatase YjhB (NUDIX family)
MPERRATTDVEPFEEGASCTPQMISSARPELCVGAVILDGDRLLMIRRGRPPGIGRWSLPGGRVERGETMAEAVVREVAEETGLTCRCGELLGWVERMGEDFHFVILDFEATVHDTSELRAGDDASDAAWVPLRELARADTVDGLVEFLTEHGVIKPGE